MSRRNRREQQRVTTEHHVRALPQASLALLKQRRAAAALPPKIVIAAYGEYEEGASLSDLAERHWQEWGCETREQAWKLIQARFRESGFKLRRGRPATSGISASRAPARSYRKFMFSQRARTEYEESQKAEREAALADPRIAQLVADQEMDERFGFRIPRSSRLVSLDVLDSWDDAEGESAAEREAIRFARRRGDFRPEAPWVPGAIARADAELRLRSAL